jgi:colicin import membrane protein
MKYFYVAEKKSAKFIVKSNVDNKLFKDNCVIAHIYPNKNGFLIYLHENAVALADKSYKDNPRFVKKAKNEHFAKRLEVAIDRTKCKTAEKKASADKKALDVFLKSLEEKATALKQKADADAKAKADADKKAKAESKQKAESKKADAKADKKADAEKQTA